MKRTVLLLVLSVLLLEANAQKSPAAPHRTKMTHKLREAAPPPPPPVAPTPPDAPMTEVVPAPPPPPPPPIVKKARFKAPKPVQPPKPIKEV